jgi:putative transferase (TIGR04331 family)
MTSLTETWGDGPLLFLGSWCLRNDCKSDWEGLDYLVVPPYGVDTYMKERDRRLSDELRQYFFPKICHLLNNFHGLNGTERFWKIVLGHWFYRFTDIVINRTGTLEKAFSEFDISEVSIVSDPSYLAGKTSIESIALSNDPKWNLCFYSTILPFLNVNREVLKLKGLMFSGAPRPKWRKNIVALCESAYARIFYLFRFFGMMRDADAYVVNPYISKSLELMLLLRLGQLPVPRRIVPFTENTKFRLDIRDELTEALKCSEGTILQTVFANTFFQCLPVCYLEGFSRLVKQTANLAAPRRPKFIFTSNNFDTDELFKVWVAQKVSSGVPYIVGQHGSNYGTAKFFANKTVEEETCDRFITWGWSDGLPQHYPGFILKPKRSRCTKAAKLYLIEEHLPHQVFTWDVNSEYQKYFDDQKHFVKTLDSDIREDLVVRLHSATCHSGFQDNQRWHEFDPDVVLEFPQRFQRSFFRKSRLVVFSYDSTGFLECLASNVPVIAFWRGGLDQIRSSAIPYYADLFEAGIIQSTPLEAALQVNRIWFNVDSWWNDDRTVGARRNFVRRYANTSSRPLAALLKAFNH